ncbi:CPBP family intramembrane glutamic endopeptidase [Deinococcus sp. UYEF24]
MKRPPFAERHPLWFVALLELAVTLVSLLVGTAAHVTRVSSEGVTATASTILSVLAVGLLSALSWWRAAGFRRADTPHDLLWFLPLLLPVVLNLCLGLDFRSLILTVELLLISLLIGFSEETIFRGLMLNALKAKGPWTAATVTSVLFRLSHALNLLSGKSGAEILIQICYALAIGFGFAAVALTTGLLWPLILVHALIDFTSFLGRTELSPTWNAVAGIGVTFAFMSYGLFLVQRGKQNTSIQGPT